MTQSPASLKEQLQKEYPYRIELHAHTNPASTCSELSPKQLVEIYASLGYHAIVVTNHFIHSYNLYEKYPEDEALSRYLNDYYETVKCGEKAGVKVLLGAEIRFTENDNDYLIYGIDEAMLREIYSLLPDGVENFRKNYPMPNSIFLQAHPFRDNMTKIDPALLDGMETLNLHQGHNSRIAIATRYAKEHQIPFTTAGSDFHHLNRGHEGAAAIRTNILPKDSFAVASLLKSKDYLFEIGGTSIVLP